MEKLLFIYNANSGKVNTYLDALHKVISPNSYKCDLCNITHGIYAERPSWKKFRKESNLDLQFLHLDEFQKQYASKFGNKFTFPIILSENATGLEVFISSEELKHLKKPEALIEIIKSRIELFKTL